MAEKILFSIDDVFEELGKTWKVDGDICGLVDTETLDGIFEELRTAWNVDGWLFCPIISGKQGRQDHLKTGQ